MRGEHVTECGPLILSDPSKKKMNIKGLNTNRLVFEDTDHQDKMLTCLNTMRKEGHFCDATLEVGGHNFPLHRAVLASCSMYMFELFSSKEVPCSKQHFKLKDAVDNVTFEVLVNYAYTGRLECDEDRVKSVYKAASLLKMHKVAEQCSRFLTENLTPQTCLGIRAFANAYSDLDLITKTNQYIEEHLQTLLEKSPEFMRLPNIVVDIVGVDSSGLNSRGEKQLCQLVLDWTEGALEERPLERLTENHRILCLTSDNSLRDCLDDLGDSDLNNFEFVSDYKKLGRRKQLLPVKGKKEKSTNGVRTLDSPCQPLPGSGASTTDLMQLENSPSTKKGQFCLVASKMVGDKSFICIVVLDDALASISIKLRSYSEVDGKMEVSMSPTREKNCHSPFESQCSLSPLAPMSSARCGLGTAVLDKRLIALGGYDRGDCLNSVEAFDLESNMWSPLKSMHTARGRFAVAQLNNKLYACGGCNGIAELASVECYDSSTDQWMNLPQMTIKRSSAGVTVCDEKLYVVGGWSGCSGHATCEMFDPEVGQWQAIAELNLGRSQTGVCTVDGEVVAVGGCDAWNCTNTVEIYDRESDKWNYLPPMSLARRGVGVAYFREKLFVVGGSDGQSSLVSVEVFDLSTRTWSFGPSLNTPRANMGIAVMDGRLFAVGGFSGKAFLDSMEYLTEDGNEWSIYNPCDPRKSECSSTPDADCSGLQLLNGEDKTVYSDVEDVWNGKTVHMNGHGMNEEQQFQLIVSSEDESEPIDHGHLSPVITNGHCDQMVSREQFCDYDVMSSQVVNGNHVETNLELDNEERLYDDGDDDEDANASKLMM